MNKIILACLCASSVIGSAACSAGVGPAPTDGVAASRAAETAAADDTADASKKCTGPVPLYVLVCADGKTDGPHWAVVHGKCELVAACADHGGPRHDGGPKVVGAGESCNGSLPPEYATICEDGLTCVRDDDRLGSSGVCMEVGHLGDRCDSNRYETRWVHCEEGLVCTPVGGILIGTVPVATCQFPRIP